MPDTFELIAGALVGTWDVMRLDSPPHVGVIQLRPDATFSWWWDQEGRTTPDALIVARGGWQITSGPTLKFTDFELPSGALMELPDTWRIDGFDAGSASVQMSAMAETTRRCMWYRRPVPGA